uniref:Uncharacterized protein n=1 Tax=Triticum urartu TaxID=4572 RepID=A0A8R7UYB8_TRIUA
MGWGYVITPETFDQIIVLNSLRCAKVALKGQAPELDEYRANPNYVTQYGYFPLHRASEMFSIEIIELLLCNGASANVRTTSHVLRDYSLSMLQLRTLAYISIWRTVYFVTKSIRIAVWQI